MIVIKSLNLVVSVQYDDNKFQALEYQMGNEKGTSNDPNDLIKIYEKALDYITNKLEVEADEEKEDEDIETKNSNEKVGKSMQETSS